MIDIENNEFISGIKKKQFKEVLNGFTKCVEKSSKSFKAEVGTAEITEDSLMGIVRIDFKTPCEITHTVKASLIHAISYSDEIWFSRPHEDTRLSIAGCVRDMRNKPRELQREDDSVG